VIFSRNATERHLGSPLSDTVVLRYELLIRRAPQTSHVGFHSCEVEGRFIELALPYKEVSPRFVFHRERNEKPVRRPFLALPPFTQTLPGRVPFRRVGQALHPGLSKAVHADSPRTSPSEGSTLAWALLHWAQIVVRTTGMIRKPNP
jgi:hypothetical protein